MRLLRPFSFWRAFDAITLGHVVLAASPAALRRSRAHERVHVRQYERWGPFFVPAYVLASAWALLRGRRLYRDNPFERQAYAHDQARVARAGGAVRMAHAATSACSTRPAAME